MSHERYWQYIGSHHHRTAVSAVSPTQYLMYSLKTAADRPLSTDTLGLANRLLDSEAPSHCLRYLEWYFVAAGQMMWVVTLIYNNLQNTSFSCHSSTLLGKSKCSIMLNSFREKEKQETTCTTTMTRYFYPQLQ